MSPDQARASTGTSLNNSIIKIMLVTSIISKEVSHDLMVVLGYLLATYQNHLTYLLPLGKLINCRVSSLAGVSQTPWKISNYLLSKALLISS